MNMPFVIGRAILGGFFVHNGINHFKNRAMLAGHAGSKGVPYRRLPFRPLAPCL